MLLYEKICEKAYADDDLIRILTRRSKSQVNATLNQYKNEVENDINKIYSGRSFQCQCQRETVSLLIMPLSNIQQEVMRKCSFTRIGHEMPKQLSLFWQINWLCGCGRSFRQIINRLYFAEFVCSLNNIIYLGTGTLG